MIFRISFFALPFLAVLMMTGCVSTISNQGIVVDDESLAQLTEQGSTHNDVLNILGPPSIVSLDNRRVWIYIGRRLRERAPFVPVELNRSVAAVHFDDKGQVNSVKRYLREDGIDIALATDTTPAPQASRSLFSIIFGNIGRVIPAGIPTE